jgi:two-component sensor histidine kinase/ABC-type amino acid transport substrate-binding protein
MLASVENTFKTLRCIFSFLIITLVSANISAQNIEFTESEKEWIKNHPVIYHGYESNWAPYEIYEDGNYSGIVGDYVKILEREIGIRIKPIPNITWDETVKGLKSGEIDFTVCAGITDERKEYLNFTKPYISSPLVIITRKEDGFVGGLSDLKGKTITLPNNYYTSELISADYPYIIIDFKEGIEESIKAVSLGEADAFVGNLVVASYYIEREGYSNLKIAAPTDYEKSQIGLAARKDWPELISISQKVFDNISYEERNEILQRWISVRYEYGINIIKIRWYIFYGLVFISIFIAIILFWNKSLKKEISKRKIIEVALESALNSSNKKSEERKVLLQEIHHRVKNNLQIIVSLLRLQQNETDELLGKKLNETITRINAIALVHEKVYLSDDLAKINLKQYVRELASDIINSFTRRNVPNLIVESNIDEVDLKSLVPMALILNELITNSLKYGVGSVQNGEIYISLNKKEELVSLTYRDNGKWIEPLDSSKGFGHTLIDSFTEQLEGSYKRETLNQTSYKFVFKDFLN